MKVANPAGYSDSLEIEVPDAVPSASQSASQSDGYSNTSDRELTEAELDELTKPFAQTTAVEVPVEGDHTPETPETPETTDAGAQTSEVL